MQLFGSVVIASPAAPLGTCGRNQSEYGGDEHDDGNGKPSINFRMPWLGGTYHSEANRGERGTGGNANQYEN
jgi:hypothetical protein